VEKYGRARQATDNNSVHAHCMLDNYNYRKTLRICNTYYFSVPTMVMPTHLNVVSTCTVCHMKLGATRTVSI